MSKHPKHTMIYGLHNGDGVIRYVGRTTHGMNRLDQHKVTARGMVGGAPVHKWMRKHGLDAIQMVVLERLDTNEGMVEREDFWIVKMGTSLHSGGMNLGAAHRGGVHGAILPAVVRAKMSASAKARVANESPEQSANRLQALRLNGESRPFAGLSHSAESRALSSATLLANGSHKGVRNGRAKTNPEEVARIRAARAAGATLPELALMFNMAKSTLFNITAGQTWKLEE